MKKYASFKIIEAWTADEASVANAIAKTAHRAVFEYEARPGFLYVRSRAISSRCNDNFDEFPAEEIRKGWRTFIGKPVFVNHHNANIDHARGVIIDAALHEDVNPDGTPDTWVEVLQEIDAVKFPKLAQRILAGEIDRTSMGCDVDYSECSACGNKARTPLEYCAHIPKQKGMPFHKQGSTKPERIREICYGVRFFENSLLVEDPADPTAFFLGVDDSGVGGGYVGNLKTASDEETLTQARMAPSAHAKVASRRRETRVAKTASEQGAMFDSHNAPTTYTEESIRQRINDMAYYGRNGEDYVRGVNDSLHDALRYLDHGDLEQANYWLTQAERYVDHRIEKREEAIRNYVPGQNHQNQPWLDVAPKPMGGPRAKTAAKTGLGERKAPPEIDTLRDENCPVCGESDSFNGSQCMICQYVKPPDPFLDPNLDIAQQVNLRQDQEENQGATNIPGSLLECDSCGAQHEGQPSVVDVVTEPDGSQVPGQEADPGSPQDPEEVVEEPLADPVPKVDGKEVEKDPRDETVKTAPPDRLDANQEFADTGKVPVDVKDGTEKPLDDKPGPDGSLPKPKDPEADPKDPKPADDPKQDPPKGESDSEDKPKHGDPCPSCGEGTLRKKEGQDGGDDAPEETDQDGSEGKDEPDWMKGKGDGDNAKSKDDDKPEGDDPVKDKETPPKDQKTKKRSSTMREGLKAIASLQARLAAVEDRGIVNGEKINAIARLAGVEPEMQVIEARTNKRLASIRRQADENNPVQPEPEPPAEAPVTTTAEEIAPISPMSPEGGSLGNEVTTPGATTETDVAPDAQTDLLQPVAAQDPRVALAMRRIASNQCPYCTAPVTLQRIASGDKIGARCGSCGEAFSAPAHLARGAYPAGGNNPAPSRSKASPSCSNCGSHNVAFHSGGGGAGHRSGICNNCGNDVYAPTTATLQRRGEAILDEPLTLSDQDVTAPVEGTQGPRPIEEVRIETEIEAPPAPDNVNDINSAQGVPGPNVTPPTVVASVVSSDERLYACQRLATLRVQAGLAQGDPLALGFAISKDATVSNEVIVNEIDTLTKVVANTQRVAAQAPRVGQPVAPRRLVPTTASAGRSMPSMAPSSVEPEPTLPLQVTASAVTDEEFLFG